ncbi:MAG: glycosyltransferase [Barnesiella sp.]|nr:glycosyltransferase [Barnesiella sp.]
MRLTPEKTIISIIIPVYNAEKHIADTLESVLSQSFSDFEIIIVNDGSVDKSEEICKFYASKDKRVKFISKENGGVSSARNAGLDAAQGEWITFVDADDTIPQNALETLISYTSIENDIVVAGYNRIQSNKILTSQIKRTCSLSNIELAHELFSPTDKTYLGVICSKLYRRTIIKDNGIHFEEAIKYNEDRLFTFEYLSKARGGTYTTTPVYNYIQHEDNAMASINGSRFHLFETDLDAFIRMNDIAKQFKDSKLTNLVYKGTIISYKWNRRLNKLYGENAEDTTRRLKHKLFSTIPMRIIIMENIKDSLKKVVRRLTHRNDRNI